MEVYAHCRHLKIVSGIHAASKQVNRNQTNHQQLLNSIQLKMHPNKTFLRCINQGFDFLGVHFGEASQISNISLENHRVKLARRCAQDASAACIGDYIARWTSWCAGVLKCCSGQFVVINPMGQVESRQLGLMNLPKETNHEKIHNNIWMDKASNC